MRDEKAIHDAFTHGYLIATANLINLHDQPTMAEDMLRELGETEGILKRLDLCDYDAKPLRKCFRNISARDKYDRERAHLLKEKSK